jgi:hypothetical protein
VDGEHGEGDVEVGVRVVDRARALGEYLLCRRRRVEYVEGVFERWEGEEGEEGTEEMLKLGSE